MKTIEEAGAHIIHVDVMDGHFVPNISFGSAVMKSLLGKTKLPFDVHLMITDPDRYIKDFVTENTEIITVHQEACIHLHRTLQMIKSHGVKAGVSLNPATPLLRWNMSLKIWITCLSCPSIPVSEDEVYPVRAGKNQKTGGNEGPAQSGSDYRRRRRHHIGERRRCGGRRSKSHSGRFLRVRSPGC